MRELSIRALTISDLCKNHGVLAEYRDEFKYVEECDAAWIEMVASNPYSQESDVALILAISGDTIVGRLGLYAAPAVYDGTETQTFWMAGFFLGKEYRQTGAGGLMILRAISFAKSLLAGSGAPPAETRQLYRKTGFHDLGLVKRFVHIYDAAVITKRLVRNGPLAAILAGGAAPILKLYQRTKRGTAKHRLTYKPVASFGAELDRLLATQTVNHFPRRSDTWNWILAHKKNLCPFEIVRGQELVGFCVLNRSEMRPVVGGPAHYFPEKVDGGLLDYYLADTSEETKRDLVLFCVDFFERQGVSLFECPVFDPDLARICSQYGMTHIGGHQIFFRPATGDKLDPASPWCLTHATGDQVLIGN